MVIKQKSTLIIGISSLVIAMALAATIFGFYAYLEWKEKNIRRNYRLFLFDSDAELFGKYVLVYLDAKIDAEGTIREKPIIEGTIKNNSNKKIYSLKMKVAFCDPEGKVCYTDTFYPVGGDFNPLVNIPDITKKAKSYLHEKDSVSFAYIIKNCPPEVTEYLKSKLQFAKSPDSRPLELVYKIESMDVR